ncbi:MAG: hypothetical protein WED33_09960 [Bacteroidia bacterium]
MKIFIWIAFLLLNLGLDAQSNSSISTLYNDAIKLMDQKKYDEAKLIFDQVIKEKPDYAESVFARGLCYLMLNEREKSCEDFNTAKKYNWQAAGEYIDKFCGKEAIGRNAKPRELKGE